VNNIKSIDIYYADNNQTENELNGKELDKGKLFKWLNINFINFIIYIIYI